MLVCFRRVFFCVVSILAYNHVFIFPMEPVVLPNSSRATSGESASSCDQVSQALERMSLDFQATQASASYRGILFLDWDETICPSSALCVHTSNRCETPFAALPSALRDNLVQIDNVVKQIIINVRAAGFFTCIVTRAETAWVHLSSRSYLPHVFALINAGVLPVLSAHGFALGKKVLFTTQIERIEGNRDQRKDFTLISFGDDEADRISFLQGCSGVQRAFIKSIKLISKPTAVCVGQQLNFLMMNLSMIISAKSNMDLMLKIDNAVM